MLIVDSLVSRRPENEPDFFGGWAGMLCLV